MKIAHLVSASLTALTSANVAQAHTAPTQAAPMGVATACALTSPAEADLAAQATDTANDIVVTAQRREQRLQSAPVAVTALNTAALEEFNVFSSRDLM